MVKKLLKNILYPWLKSSPDFLIIGAQKAGTTSLYNYLLFHPQIMGNKTWKEIRYFDLKENYDQGFGWYLSHFPNKLSKGEKLTFDASPGYLYFPYIPQLIKQDLGDIKMIAILRNPVDRAYSAWKMYHSFVNNPQVSEFSRRIADERTFAEAIEQELDNQCKLDIYPYDYINRGKYAEQLENYYQYFNRETLLVLSLDQLQKELETTLNQVCDFLNIERFSPKNFESFQEKKYNIGLKVPAKSDDLEVLENLKEYFIPYNQKLYELLNWDVLW